MAIRTGAATLIKRIVCIALLVVTLYASAGQTAVAVTAQSDWASTQTDHFIIYATKRSDIQSIARLSESVYADMADRYHFEQTQKIKLYIYTNREAFLNGSPSDGAVGYASPEQNAVFILNGVGNATVTLGHELNHIIFIRSVPRIDTVPEWFIEGLAIYESQPGVEAANLEKYALVKDIPELVGKHGVNGWNGSQRDYAQGYLMVGFIADKYGRYKLYQAIGRMQSGEDFNTGLLRAVGVDEKQLNSDWRSYARKRQITIWLMQLQDIGLYLMGGIVLLVIIWAPIHKRKRLRDMEDEDDAAADDGTEEEPV